MFDTTSIFKSNHVTKYVFEKENDICIESVLYQYKDRTVICVSTQCGCPVGCVFCGTGNRFIRNLNSNEIIDQVVFICKDITVSRRFQIMLMSMGEPFLNYNSVRKSIIKLNELYPCAELLLSTIAPYSMIDNWDDFINLSKSISKLGIQFSLHALNDYRRDKLIPYFSKVGVGTIIYKALEWNRHTGRPPYFNFVLNQDNKQELYDDITERLRGIENKIYLTFSVECPLRDDTYSEFDYKLYEYMKDNLSGFNIRMFNPEGQDDIGAGCGQLWYVQEWMKNR